MSNGSLQRDLNDHAGTSTRFTLDRTVATQPGDSLAHAGEPNAFAGARFTDSVRVKPPAPVLHFEEHRIPATIERDIRLRGLRVFSHVGQRLLGNAEQGRFD
jgi:hypothetical protein